MESVVLLCGAGSCGCPAVEVSRNGVSIGEATNLVKLAPEEWNILVAKVKSGELTTFEEMVGDCGCGCSCD